MGVRVRGFSLFNEAASLETGLALVLRKQTLDLGITSFYSLTQLRRMQP